MRPRFLGGKSHELGLLDARRKVGKTMLNPSFV